MKFVQYAHHKTCKTVYNRIALKNSPLVVCGGISLSITFCSAFRLNTKPNVAAQLIKFCSYGFIPLQISLINSISKKIFNYKINQKIYFTYLSRLEQLLQKFASQIAICIEHFRIAVHDADVEMAHLPPGGRWRKFFRC